MTEVRKLLSHSNFLRTNRRLFGEGHHVHDPSQAIQAIGVQERDPILYDRARAAEFEMAGSDISLFLPETPLRIISPSCLRGPRVRDDDNSRGISGRRRRRGGIRTHTGTSRQRQRPLFATLALDRMNFETASTQIADPCGIPQHLRAMTSRPVYAGSVGVPSRRLSGRRYARIAHR